MVAHVLIEELPAGSVAGKNVVITGGTAGIGYATAVLLTTRRQCICCWQDSRKYLEHLKETSEKIHRKIWGRAFAETSADRRPLSIRS
jgi:NAD(P)-dependent dehydrogenase (short-subunit alcohol dehydrogenase family)